MLYFRLSNLVDEFSVLVITDHAAVIIFQLNVDITFGPDFVELWRRGSQPAPFAGRGAAAAEITGEGCQARLIGGNKKRVGFGAFIKIRLHRWVDRGFVLGGIGI